MKLLNSTIINTRVILFIIALFILHSCSKNSPLRIDYTGQVGTVTDIDGNSYKTIGIGSQIWMAENLKVTKYNDGTSLPCVSDNRAWRDLLMSGYCWYDNNEADYKETYGALYNWSTIKYGNICPTGWHVPGDSEWHTLVLNIDAGTGLRYDTESTIAGGKMKASGTDHWESPNAGANNESGFTALPAGSRGTDGTFFENGISAFWWSSTQRSFDMAWYRFLKYDDNNVYRDYFYVCMGFSIRCIKDD